MGSLTRQLRTTGHDQLINQAIISNTLEVIVPDVTTARRVQARIKKRNFDLEKFTVKFIKDGQDHTLTSKGVVKKAAYTQW
jgi:hypothetical protein